MRVLVLHSEYTSGPLSGENRVVHEEVDLLRGGGHDVELMLPSPDRLSRWSLASRTVLSSSVANEVRQFVRARRVGVVHAHNLFPGLGPAVLSAASDAGAAVVVTLHNFRLICIAGTFYRDGRVCEDCAGRSPARGVLHGCYRGSRAQSAVLGAGLGLARARGTFESVDRFLAVSEFVRQKHIASGIAPDRIGVKRNVVPSTDVRKGPGSYFLILSRLVQEKGVAAVVRAWRPELGDLRVVGDGPERAALEHLARGRGVRVEGPVAAAAVAPLVAQARALLLPSRWYEGQPRVVVEAYAAGVPVVASRIGGLAEVVVDGQTGITVDPGDPSGWQRAATLLADPDEAVRLGAGAYEHWRQEFSPARGLERLEAAYEAASAYRRSRA